MTIHSILAEIEVDPTLRIYGKPPSIAHDDAFVDGSLASAAAAYAWLASLSDFAWLRNTVKGGFVAYAWFVWTLGYTGEPLDGFLPRLHGLGADLLGR